MSAQTETTTTTGSSTVVSTQMTQSVDKKLTNMYTTPEGVVGVQSTFTHVIEPLRPIAANDEQFEFDLPLTSSYVDLKKMQLYVRGRMVRKDGSAIAPLEEVSITNNFLHSLFQSVTVFVGHGQLEMFSSDHPYKAYIRQLQKYESVFVTTMRCEGFTPEQCNRTLIAEPEWKPASARGAFIAASSTLEMCGETLLDVCQTDAYLLPACPFRIRYRKNREPFYVMTSEENKEQEYKFIIDKIALHVPTISVQPSLVPLLEIQTDEAAAAYRFEAMEVKQFPLAKGTITRNYQKVFEGRLPSRMLIGFFDQSAYAGARAKNALMASDVDVRSISLSVNGVAIRETQVDYGENIYMDAYHRFISWMQKTDKMYMVKFKDFINGYRYYAFDLMETCDSNKGCTEEALTQGYINLKLELRQALKGEDVVMLIFYLSPKTLFINKQRVAQLESTIV